MPSVVAHRGYSAVAPENTLAAVAAALASGADYVEIDVHSTADGVPVVLHDDTVDRTTDGTGAVAALPATYVTGLDAGTWHSPGYAGQRVPTLDQVLDLMAGSTAGLLLEVKGPRTGSEVAAIVAAVARHRCTDRTILQSFDEQVLRDARSSAPELRRALLRDDLDADPVAAARSVGAVSYHPYLPALLARPETVAELNAAGLGVMVFTVDDPADWATLVALGVDAIITNRPAALHTYLTTSMIRASL
ncbi:glycerophosphodiester phosphodiesterase family protein [Actinomycetes bacterium KLBMP 9797]